MNDIKSKNKQKTNSYQAQVYKDSFLSLFKNPDFLLKFVIVILILIALLTGGLFYYNYSLKQKQKNLEQNIADLQSQRDKKTEKELIGIYEKSQSLQNLLSNHIYSSRLLTMIEENTLDKAQVLSMNFNFSQKILDLKIQAKNYNILASQVSVFEKDSRVEKVELGDVDLGQVGQARTDLKIYLNADFLEGTK